LEYIYSFGFFHSLPFCHSTKLSIAQKSKPEKWQSQGKIRGGGDIKEYGGSEDKTRIEVCKLLNLLSQQLIDIAQTIKDIEMTLYNEEYE
jgi:hypothetical protein